MQIVNVPMINSLDVYGRQAFHTEGVDQHVTGAFPRWLMLYARENNRGVNTFYRPINIQRANMTYWYRVTSFGTKVRTIVTTVDNP